MHEEYPRPDFVRTPLTWKSLNGSWDFLFDDEDIGLLQRWHKTGLPEHASSGDDNKHITKREIRVPFVFQSPSSGVHERAVHEVLWYERQIQDIRHKDLKDDTHRLLLRFGAVDYHATIWVDGNFVGEHRGGHVPFDLDISHSLESSTNAEGEDAEGESHRLTVRVFDSATDLTQPRGKQFWGPKPENIYYTPSSGIWQSVWLESVPILRIGDGSQGTILRSTDIEGGNLDSRIVVFGRRARQSCSVEVRASIGGILVSESGKKRLPKDEDFVRFNLNTRLSQKQIQQLPPDLSFRTNDHSRWRNGVALWSPESPLLYDLTISLLDSDGQRIDQVRTTIGMRSIDWTVGDGTFRLNGRSYFHAMFLDQGYWPDTIMTAPSQSALKRDIELSKKMGFNGCRKHQKVEDPVFMYWADRLGFLVWGEMASSYRFSLDYIDRFNQEWMEMVRRDISHPCIVAWTPVNESWGYPDLVSNTRQRDHVRSLYYMTRTLDPTRPINDNCGWEHVVTDLSTFHDYADASGMAERCASIQSILGRGKPMFLNEIYGRDGTYSEASKHQRGAPILCTEFGGVNIAAADDPGRQENWGYTTAKDSEDLLRRVENIVLETVKPGHICGVVWTQFSDIEQEQNGLYTFDRREKLPSEKMKAIMDRARETYHSNRR